MAKRKVKEPDPTTLQEALLEIQHLRVQVRETRRAFDLQRKAVLRVVKAVAPVIDVDDFLEEVLTAKRVPGWNRLP